MKKFRDAIFMTNMLFVKNIAQKNYWTHSCFENYRKGAKMSKFSKKWGQSEILAKSSRWWLLDSWRWRKSSKEEVQLMLKSAIMDKHH